MSGYFKSILPNLLFMIVFNSDLIAQAPIMVDFGIDPGHDVIEHFGACGMDGRDGINEEHINLAIALQVEYYLVNAFGLTVIMTYDRHGASLSTHDRAEIVSGIVQNPHGHPLSKAVWALSIHANAQNGFDCDDPISMGVSGQETYWSDDYWDYVFDLEEKHNSTTQDLKSQSVAYYAHHGLIDEIDLYGWDFYDRKGIIHSDTLSDFLDHPVEDVGTALIEVGYLTNQDDWDMLNDEFFQDDAAYGIAKGLDDLYLYGDNSDLRSGGLEGNETWNGNIIAAGHVIAGPGERLDIDGSASVLLEVGVNIIADGAGAVVFIADGAQVAYSERSEFIARNTGTIIWGASPILLNKLNACIWIEPGSFFVGTAVGQAITLSNGGFLVFEGDVELPQDALITVETDGILYIEPGAVLKMGNNAKILVKGRLDAQGTAADPITFKSINISPSAGDWAGIDIDLRGGPAPPSLIKYVHIQDANIGVLGRYANNTVVENSTFQNCKIGPYAWYTVLGSSDRMQILNNTITDNTRHGIYNYYSHPIISGNTITDVSDPNSNYGFGIYLRSSSAIVGNNTITGSKRDGIQGYGSGAAKIYYSSSLNPLGGGNSITNNTGNGVYVTASSVPILGWSSGTPGNNIIVNNSGKELYNNTPSVVNATCNDWGGSEPLSSELFGLVYYDPWIGSNGVCDQYAALPGNSLSEWLYAMLNVIPSYLYAQGNGISDRNRQATGEFISGNYEEAARLFKEIIRDFPNADGVQYALTLAYESHKELGKRGELRTYLTGLSNQQANTKVKRSAKLLIMHDMEGAGEFTEALEAGDKLLSENPSDEEVNEVLFRQGMIHAWLDESKLASQKFNEIIRRFPGTDEALFAAEQNEYFGDASFGKKAFGSDLENSSIPKEYSLSNNYPNPFNPVTKIEFTIPETGLTTLIIYDITGREVTRLIDGNMSAGYHSVNWNASNVASGIYFYRLTSGDFVSTKKMVLLK
ncbi:MAG: right-handed parallel beta-helix repeat-containing protein [Candidatus Marinimicrobia bacterium]|nr:right-handed parallel beta-helix repeat-containing protein [Candidatus Neomarinimicrobiota bacterium]